MDKTVTPVDRDSRKRDLLGEFRRFLPGGSVLHTEEDLKPYECDGLTAYRQIPLIAVLPDSVEQVQEVMRTCSRLGVPVVARGAGTGLSGGALPLAGGVLLSLAKLHRILEVDPINRTARVQPGVRNLAISEHVAPLGLYYAPDPSSQIACSIGGNVAENAGGLHCLKYGLTVHNILELTVITADGECITIGSGALDTPRLRPACPDDRLGRSARGGGRGQGEAPSRSRPVQRSFSRRSPMWRARERRSARSSPRASFPPDWK